ncbi:MAG: NAD-dependent protein deacetylase 1 [Actinomycetota bacterium]|nr:NAD-dependent protein deacetylase 1 [Actinomycetota bacterium]
MRPAVGGAVEGPESFDQLVALVAAGEVAVLTGAGLSTESGIPDYRGPDGTRRVLPMQYGEFVGSTAARQRYWARSFVGWQPFARASPNVGHHEVARLLARGAVTGLVTQNVDGLHQEAGARDVLELHGSLDQVVCLTCGDRTSRASLHERMAEANPGFAERVLSAVGDASAVTSQIRPDGDIVLADDAVTTFHLQACLVCGHDTLKPDVVFFGESVPKEVVERAFDFVDSARSLVVLGSSLAVMSGYRFVRRAHRDGKPVAIVTTGPSRGDGEATIRLHTPLGATLTRLTVALG